MDTYKVDYHIHSYYSDGINSPVELVKIAGHVQLI